MIDSALQEPAAGHRADAAAEALGPVRASEYQQLLEASADALVLLDEHERVVHANRAAATLLGGELRRLVGRPVRAVIALDGYGAKQEGRPDARAAGALDAVLAPPDAGRPEPFEAQLAAADGRTVWVELRACPLHYRRRPHRLLVLRDVSERRRSQAALGKAHRALRALGDCNRALTRARSERELLPAVCRVIVASGYRFAWVGRAENDARRTVRPVASAGDERGYLREAEVAWGPGPRGDGPGGRAIKSLEPVIVRDVATDPDFAPWRRAALARGYGSVIALPLAEGEERYGVLCIYAGERDAFDADEVELLGELAGNLHYGVRTLRAARAQGDTERALRAATRRLEKIFNGVDVFIWEEDLSAVWRELEAIRASGERSLRRHLKRNPGLVERLAGLVRINEVNAAALHLFGFERKPCLGEEVDRYLAPESLQLFTEELFAMWAGEKRVRGEVELSSASGRTVAGLLSVPIPQSETEARHVPVSVVDISDRKRAEEQVRRLATYDELTGLLNRHAFMSRVRDAIDQAARRRGEFALLIIDLDHFKDVNDTLGHAVGDRLLALVGRRIEDCVRRSDRVARLGGDEFAVLFPELADRSHAATVAEKLIRALGEPFVVDDNTLHLGASAGISIFEPGVDDAERMLAQADLALYRAKEQGRETYRFHSDELDAAIRTRVTLANEIRAALELGQLSLHYQPQLHLASGAITGLEALVRWTHPERGPISPAEFIPIAEATGLILPLGRWVASEACRQARRWLDQGLLAGVVAINVSGVQFKASSLADDIEAVLAASGLPPRHLELELTESTLMRWREAGGDALSRLRRLGVGFAIDDFGTGYSSLEYLRTFPVNRLKIAQEFVTGIDTQSHDTAIVAAIIGLARALGIRVIAEGVESAAAARWLAARGCHDAQGYHFARPMPAEAVTELLRQAAEAPVSSGGAPEAE